jgi:hypothetical protein
VEGARNEKGTMKKPTRRDDCRLRDEWKDASTGEIEGTQIHRSVRMEPVEEHGTVPFKNNKKSCKL